MSSDRSTRLTALQAAAAHLGLANDGDLPGGTLDAFYAAATDAWARRFGPRAG